MHILKVCLKDCFLFFISFISYAISQLLILCFPISASSQYYRKTFFFLGCIWIIKSLQNFIAGRWNDILKSPVTKWIFFSSAVFGSRYSRVNQVKFVEDSLSRRYHFKFIKGCLPHILLGPFFNTLTLLMSNIQLVLF